MERMMAAKNNARLRRTIAKILFEQGPMTRVEVFAKLLSSGEFRTLPNESSLTAMLAKNLQIVQRGFEMVDTGTGIKTKQAIYAINDEIIEEEEDLLYSRPFSTMTKMEQSLATPCPSCRQRRITKERWNDCLVCQRRGL